MGTDRKITTGQITGTLTFPSGNTIDFTATRVELKRVFAPEYRDSWEIKQGELLSEELLMDEVRFGAFRISAFVTTPEKEQAHKHAKYLPDCRCRVVPHVEATEGMVNVPEDVIKRILYVVKRLKKKKIVPVKIRKRHIAKTKGRKLAIKT